ncbi:MAG: IS3 family transposase [Bacteroidota bacterium]
MKAHKEVFGIERMCRVFQISRSSYYKWLGYPISARAQENERLTVEIRRIYEEHKGIYGSAKIHDQLCKEGYTISENRVARLMQEAGLKSITRKKAFRVSTTDSDHNEAVCMNILNRVFKMEAPSRAWVSDISYIPTAQGWLYLTMIMDLYDRKIIGWSLSEGLSAEETTIQAWKMACSNRAVGEGMIFHSDRGIQYAAEAFRDLLPEQVRQSMSRKANCWDNAVAESFFKILKSELVNHVSFSSREMAKREIFIFIEIWYNRQRTHSTLGYMTPEEFSQQFYSSCA